MGRPEEPSRIPARTSNEAAGGVLTAKQAPHRPGTAPAHGLRAAGAAVILPQTTTAKETTVSRPSFRARLEALGERALPSGTPALSITDAAHVNHIGGQTAFQFTVGL